MDQETKQRLYLEILWLLFALVFAGLIVLPILLHEIAFPFLKYNFVLIVAFVLATRYLFFMDASIFHKNIWFKFVIIFTTIPIFVLLMDGVHIFQIFLDDIGLQDLVSHLDFKSQKWMMRYIRTEYFFFGVGSCIAVVLLPIKMIRSIWKTRNKTTQ